MKKPLRVLFVKDSAGTIEPMLRELQHCGYEPIYERVETASTMKMMLENRTWDIILADHSIPYFSAIGALTQLQLSGLDLPLIIMSGSISEGNAVACMEAGVHDYVMKDDLTRLVPAIEREISAMEKRRKYHLAEDARRKSEDNLANAQQIARLGNWEWNVAKDELNWSDETCHIFGPSPRSSGATYEALLNFVHPADREYVKKIYLRDLI